VHNERCTPGSGRGRPETCRRKPARRWAPTSPERPGPARESHQKMLVAVFAFQVGEAVQKAGHNQDSPRVPAGPTNGGNAAPAKPSWAAAVERSQVLAHHPGAGCQVRAAAGVDEAPGARACARGTLPRRGHLPRTVHRSELSARPAVVACGSCGGRRQHTGPRSLQRADPTLPAQGCAGGTRGSDRGKADDSGRCAWAAGFRP